MQFKILLLGKNLIRRTHRLVVFLPNQNIFLFHHSSHENDLSHLSTITKKSLNKLCSSHLVGVQEAVHEIAGLDLVICSDYLTDVSLGRALFLRDNKQNTQKQRFNIKLQNSRSFISLFIIGTIFLQNIQLK